MIEDLPTPPLPDAIIKTLVVGGMAVAGASWLTLKQAARRGECNLEDNSAVIADLSVLGHDQFDDVRPKLWVDHPRKRPMTYSVVGGVASATASA